MKTVFSKILAAKQSKGLYQTLLVVFGNAFSQGFSAIALILITRQLGPVRFGEFSVGFALLLILNRLNDLGMTAVVQKYAARGEESAEINRIFSYTLRAKLLGSLGIFVVGMVASPFIITLLHFQRPEIIYAAFALNVVTVLYEHLQAMLQSIHRFGQSVVVNATQAFTKFLGAGVLMFLGSVGSIPAYVWYMSAPLVPLLFAKKLFPSWLKLDLKGNFSREKILSSSLARHSAIAFVSAGIIENIDILFVQGYLSSYETGLLGGVSRIALLFNLAAYSLGTVLNPRVAKYREAKHLKAFMKKSWLVVAASALGFLAFVPFSSLVVQYTIGPEYLQGSSILVILMAAAFVSIAVMPFIALFFSFDHPWFFSVSGIMQLVIILVGNAVFVPIYGLQAAAWTRLMARLAFFVFSVAVGMWAYRKMKN
ncbi:MAG: hypothetical protein COY80_01100 [Candidatus Pacebacteria bacterium CG_4_10_14_0_8_um_filter_42_14]|nr:MAG: hypothetical protein COY80_01100 [Candidatus Pacebacteria bacterium CG_4_10_14_0_8_um_filter_42_14]